MSDAAQKATEDAEDNRRDSREASVDVEKQIERALKLLSHTQNNGNENEAAVAAAKLQELLAAHNLDMATIEKAQAGGSSAVGAGKREDAATAGGQYQYQRDLWRAVAKLNFCMYFSTEKRVQRSARRRLADGTMVDVPRMFTQRQHRLVGRVVNTTLTRTMAGYLEQTIERLCRERYLQQSQFFSRDATSYREGMADNIVGRLQSKRLEKLREDEARRRADMERRASNVASDTALSLSVYIDEETDRNNDFIHGEGWSARQVAKRAANAAYWAEQERKQAEWDAAHPEEVAARVKKERARERAAERRRANGTGGWGRSCGGGSGKPRNEQAYWAGYDRGGSVGIDPQAESGRSSQGKLS